MLKAVFFLFPFVVLIIADTKVEKATRAEPNGKDGLDTAESYNHGYYNGNKNYDYIGLNEYQYNGNFNGQNGNYMEYNEYSENYNDNYNGYSDNNYRYNNYNDPRKRYNGQNNGFYNEYRTGYYPDGYTGYNGYLGYNSYNSNNGYNVGYKR